MDTSMHNDEPDRVTDISPDGDVVLIVGGDGVRLRVYSQCLRSASPVFRVMFGPNWGEGQKLSREWPTEVPLPEDDADAMRIICYVIHHRNDLVPHRLSTKNVLQIAIEANKYELITALKFTSVQWLKPPPVVDRVGMGQLLASSFLFNNTNVFAGNTLSLIINYTGSYMNFLYDELTCRIIPSNFFHLLEERRAKMRAEVCQLLITGKKAACKCGWGKTRSEQYRHLLVEYGPIEMLEVPIAEVLAKMARVSTEDMDGGYCSTESFTASHHDPITQDETFLGQQDALMKKAVISMDFIRNIGATNV